MTKQNDNIADHTSFHRATAIFRKSCE